MNIKKWFKKRKASIDPVRSKNIWTIALLLLVVVYMIFIFSRSVWKNYEINKSVVNLEEELNNLEKRFEYNKNLLSYYQSRSFLEKEARSKLGMKKEGETVLALPREKQKEEAGVEIEGLEKEKEPANIQKWWHFFF